MKINDDVLERLRKYVGEINQTSQLPVRFHPLIWGPWLQEGGGSKAIEVLNWLLQSNPETIDRSQLQSMAKEATSSDSRRALFIATMIWGSGTTNGRGPRYTCAALQSGDLDETLKITQDLVEADELAEAYRRFSSSNVDGVGPSFFTKWLWAVGSNGNKPRSPLILDDRVWSSLGSLGWDSKEAAGTRLRAKRYEAYVDAVHEWATALQVAAQKLELFLFTKKGELN